MLRFGLCRPDEFMAHQHGARGWRPCSYLLLNATGVSDQERVRVFESVIRHVQLGNGVYRTTFRGRLADVDAAATHIIAQRWPRTKDLGVHDLGASDCLASADWFALLQATFPDVSMTASDIVQTLTAVTKHRRETWIFDGEGVPLQFVRPPFVIDFRQPGSILYPWNRLLWLRARRRLGEVLPLIEEVSWPDLLDTTVFTRPPWQVERISLVHPRARDLARLDPRFHLSLQSAFTPLPSAVHVIRTMNLLNPGYFDTSVIRSSVSAVAASLREGGIWVVGRTPGDAPGSHVTIFARDADRFVPIGRVGNGWELESVVLDRSTASTTVLSPL